MARAGWRIRRWPTSSDRDGSFGRVRWRGAARHAVAERAERAGGFALADVPALTPRQRALLDAALETIRLRLDQAPIAFRLLPPTFTLSELQQTYELLLGRRLHKASFRRALQAAWLVEPTDEWRSEGRGRPAQLFRYAPRRRRSQRRGVRFDLLVGIASELIRSRLTPHAVQSRPVRLFVRAIIADLLRGTGLTVNGISYNVYITPNTTESLCWRFWILFVLPCWRATPSRFSSCLQHPLARALPRQVREEAMLIARRGGRAMIAPVQTLRLYHQTAHLLGACSDPATRNEQRRPAPAGDVRRAS